MIQKGKNKYLTLVIWIGMIGCVCDEVNGCVSNSNIGFDSFLRGVNGYVCLCHDWCRKEYRKV